MESQSPIQGTSEDRLVLAGRVNELRNDGLRWNAIGERVGIPSEAARALWRRIYGDKAKKKAALALATGNAASDVPAADEHDEAMASAPCAEDVVWNEREYRSSQEFSVEEWIEFLKRAQAVHDCADPVVTQSARIIKTDKPIAIQFVSCWHLGSRFVQYTNFQEYLRKLKDTARFYWAVLGDEYDNFPATFKSAEAVWGQLIPPKFQRVLVRAIIHDLAKRDKILYGCWSNHPGHDEKTDGENRMKTIYREAGIPYFDGKGVLKLTVGKEQYIIYSAHMFPGNSQWNKNHPQIKALVFDVPSADIVVQGHRHGAGVQKVYHSIMEYDIGNRRNTYSWLVETGAAKDGNDYYAIRKWGRGLFEWPTLVLYPDKHLVKLVDDLEDLEYFLS